MSDERTPLREVVADYLRNHPDFLSEHPEVLEFQQLNHSSGAAVSLIERQVEQLRAANDDLNKQLNHLIRVATENEELMTRLHGLTLDLMAIGPLDDFFDSLDSSLLNDFNADILKICLFDPELADDAGAVVTRAERDDPAVETLLPMLERGSAVCGRLNGDKLGFLFGEKSRWVQSVAVIPLGENGESGLVAIGSSDESRFYPGMGTLFLDLLADMITTRLSAAVPREQRRSA